jgi:predicted NBD/HSP70 family sugar kinase
MKYNKNTVIVRSMIIMKSNALESFKTTDTCLGIDFGGTKMLIGEADSNGKLLVSRKYPTGYMDQKQAICCIQEAVDDYMKNRPKNAGRIMAMGIGMIGRIDGENGIWFQIDKQRNEEIPLARLMSERYGMPCVIDNDVRCAAAAEARFGCGKNSKDFIYLNVGTGIAACAVTGGRVIRGGHFNAGEVGHTQVSVEVGVRCACGRTDCVEAIAAGIGIDLCARLLAPEYPDTVLRIPEGDERVNGREVFEKAQTDALCGKLTDNAARGIANLIMNLVRVTDPDTVALGGGLVCGGALFSHIQKYLHDHTMRFVTGGVKLTELDPEIVGLLGACALAMNSDSGTRKDDPV